MHFDWCSLHVEFLFGLKRSWDQKLSSGMLLTFTFTLLSQFRFADTEQYRLITLTFLRTWIIVVEIEGLFKGEHHRY